VEREVAVLISPHHEHRGEDEVSRTICGRRPRGSGTSFSKGWENSSQAARGQGRSATSRRVVAKALSRALQPVRHGIAVLLQEEASVMS